jgi:hypothetical protein
MTAKRKELPPKEDAANREQRVMDGLLASILQTEGGAAWAKQYFDEANNLSDAKKWKLTAAREEAFISFLRYLDGLPASHDIPKGFHPRWVKWIRRFEKEEIAKMPPKDRTEDRVGKWVKRAWVTTGLNDSDDLQTGRFVYHDQEPSVDNHPIPVIVIHQKGQWRMTDKQSMAATAHPFVRAFCQSLPPLPDKAAVLDKMRWALDLEGKANSAEDQLMDAANYLNATLCGDVRACLPKENDQCVPFDQLPENAPLWMLLNAAIGFGRMLQHQEIYGDGSVEKILHKGISSDIGLTPREVIARLMDDYFNEKGSEATSMSLLEWMGAIRQKSDGTPIVFPDKRGDGLRNVSWEYFDQTVKNEKRSRKAQG